MKPEEKASSRPELFILCVLLFSFAYFFHPVLYDNSLSRLDLTYSIVYKENVIIDDYHLNTADKAFHNGHYYSDKAPGLSFAAVPLLAAIKSAFHPAKPDPADPLIAYLLTLIAVALPSALSFVLLFRMIACLGVGRAASIFFTICGALGTICFTYSTQFYGHQFAASLEIAALYFITFQLHNKKPPTAVQIAFAGFLLGFAVISDYPSAAPAAAFAVLAFYLLSPKSRILFLIAGAAVPAAILAAYNIAAFGGPVALGYFKEVSPVFKEGMGRGLGGVTTPNPATMLKLLFMPQRGLFWASPFLLFALPGIAAAFRLDKKRKAFFFACIAAAASIWLINGAYYEPYGGFAPGPRFLTNAIPFLCVPVALSWNNLSQRLKSIFAALCAFAIAYNFIFNAIDPHVPHVFSSPVFQFFLPLLRQGFSPDNIGAMNGLRGMASFAPLAIFLAGAAAFFIIKYTDSRLAMKKLVAVVPFLAVMITIFIVTGQSLPRPRESGRYLSEFWIRRGMLYFYGRAHSPVEDTETCLLHALDADPGRPQPYISLAAYYLLLKSPGRAEPLLLRAKRLGYNKDVEELLRKTAEQKAGEAPRITR